jgi:hypothetical protein
MNKNLLYVVLALALGSGAWFTWQRNQKKSTLDKLDLNFSVPDTSSIDKIVITQQGGSPFEMERQKDRSWSLNKKYKVAPVLMDVLLSTIRNIEMQRPLAKNEKKTVEEAMKTRHRKVEIFVGGEIYKTYFLGDDAPENKGTYIRFENGDPYVAHIRGFTGFLTPRYNVTENEWRDRLLFASTPASIQSVEIKYTKSPSDNFKVGFTGRHFFLEGAERFDTNATATLLLQFKQVYIERYIVDFTKNEQDSLLKSGHEWSLDLVDIDKSKSNTLWIYQTSDADRSLAYLPKTKEWATIQNRNLNPVRLKRHQLLGGQIQ